MPTDLEMLVHNARSGTLRPEDIRTIDVTDINLDDLRGALVLACTDQADVVYVMLCCSAKLKRKLRERLVVTVRNHALDNLEHISPETAAFAIRHLSDEELFELCMRLQLVDEHGRHRTVETSMVVATAERLLDRHNTQNAEQLLRLGQRLETLRVDRQQLA